jgi:two-component system, response regulator, stage 0 sporulation protein F
MGSTVLVVDDDDLLVDLVCEVLGEEGCAVTVAPTGQAALAALAEARPDVILLDNRLPDLTGADVATRYHAMLGPHAPIVLCTAARETETLAAATRAVGVLQKPFQLVDLLTALRPFVDALAASLPQERTLTLADER